MFTLNHIGSAFYNVLPVLVEMKASEPKSGKDLAPGSEINEADLLAFPAHYPYAHIVLTFPSIPY